MSFVQTQTVGRVVQFPGGIPAQFLAPTGNRVNATAGAVVTAEAAVPSGGRVLMIRATDADSILFLGGEAPYLLKTNETHFRVLRVGAADVAVQLESVETL
jgi:hypothetical protein